MAHKAVPRQFGGRVDRVASPRLDRIDPRRWTGVLTLTWTFPRESPLVVGNGRLTLHEERAFGRRMVAGQRMQNEPVRELVLDVVRRGTEGMPVIPGSSIKGAVRQVYEVMTPSCEPFRDGACRPRPPGLEACPACSLFGGAGLAARATFHEAVPEAEAWRRQIVRRSVPQGWEAQKPEALSVRMYGQGKARNREGLAAENERTWAAHGTFTARIRLLGASDDELGLLFASMGIGWDGEGPALRLGGRKFHGFGGASVRLIEATRHQPWQPAATEQDPEQWATRLRDEALDRIPERRGGWEAVHATLADGY
jgi:hypothetical protein